MNLYRDFSAPNAMEEWRAECEREQAIARATGKSAMERAIEAIQAGAKAATMSDVDMRAGRFRASFPYFIAQLDIICAGLSMQSWPDIVRYLTARIDSAAERRWQGFGGETARINMTAARIVATEMAANETMVAAE